MGLFGFGSRAKNRKFDYIPRYYDPDKERLEEQLKKYDESERDNADLLKSRIRSGLKMRGKKVDANFRNKQVRKSNFILLGVLVVLIIVSYIFLTEYLPRIIEVFEDTSTK